MRASVKSLAFAACLALVATMLSVAPSMAEPSDAQKLELKAAVLDHIDAHSADGVYYFVDPESTTLRELSFVAMHPVVFERQDGTYALCADFRDGSGEMVLIDYYLRPMDGTLTVLTSVAGKRSILMQLGERFGL